MKFHKLFFLLNDFNSHNKLTRVFRKFYTFMAILWFYVALIVSYGITTSSKDSLRQLCSVNALPLSIYRRSFDVNCVSNVIDLLSRRLSSIKFSYLWSRQKDLRTATSWFEINLYGQRLWHWMGCFEMYQHFLKQLETMRKLCGEIYRLLFHISIKANIWLRSLFSFEYFFSPPFRVMEWNVNSCFISHICFRFIKIFFP